MHKFLFLFLFFVNNSWSAVKISTINEVPIDNALEVEFPDGVKRIVSASEEPIPAGLSFARGKYIAKQIATLRAETTLAKFISGAEFEKTIAVQELIKNSNDQASFTQDMHIEHVSKMRTAALRGVEIIESFADPKKKIVRVVVGISFSSINTANKYSDILADREYYDDASKKEQLPSENEVEHWVHPSLSEEKKN